MRISHRSTYLRLFAAAALVSALVVGVDSAGAGREHPAVVSEHPVAWTPHILDGTVHALAAVGDTLVVAGSFTGARDARDGTEFSRRHLLAFGRHTGRLSRLEVDLDGPVYALAPGPDGTVYVGGGFRTVNGVPQRGLARIRLADGARDPGFHAAVNWGTVGSLARHRDRLYLGGSFTAVNGVPRAGLARLDASTGAVDDGFDAELESAEGRVHVRALALAPGGGRLAAVGAFTAADGLRRPQLVMMDTAKAKARVSGWYTDAFAQRCSPAFRTYLRGVDFSPDGSYLVTTTTGGMTHPERMCDAAVRFEATGTGRHSPTWVNHTGGHSLYSVAVTGRAVYVGGHQRWHDNPHGQKSAGPGAVPREGIAALHPGTGKALPWNPGRARGVGVQAFLATKEGLFVGSDTTRIGGVYRARIAMLPLP